MGRLPAITHLPTGTIVIGAEGEWVEVGYAWNRHRYGRYLQDDELERAIVRLEIGRNHKRLPEGDEA